jgi:sulfate/thiosulfate transport system substrate-binding protein
MHARIRAAALLLPALVALVVAGCGGASDSTDGSETASSPDGVQLSLVAYAVPKVGFDKVIPLFQKTPEGQGVSFSQSYGGSGDQSRKVEAGLKTDVVNFSAEPDVTRLVDAGLVDSSWKDDEFDGIVSSSVVTLVVHKGNPKSITDWDDLLEPGVEVVTPNPFSSGSAKWNLLAPYALKSEGGKNPQAGLDYLTDLISHVKTQPKSGREATELFLQGTGDVLLSYENEAIFAERSGEDVEHHNPPTTFLIQNPFAILNTSEHPQEAQAFKEFLYSTEGQRAWGEAGFRPVDEAVAKEFASQHPDPDKLYTVADLGGWDKVNAELFEPETGSVAKIYDSATN